MNPSNIVLIEDDEYKAPLGWLSPSGRYFPCPDNGHRAFAASIFEKFGGRFTEDIQDPDFYAEERLLKGGWMKLTNEDIYTYYCKFTTMYNDPTREQFEALEKWAQNNDLAPPWEYKQSRHAHYQYEFNDDFELDR